MLATARPSCFLNELTDAEVTISSVRQFQLDERKFCTWLLQEVEQETHITTEIKEILALTVRYPLCILPVFPPTAENIVIRRTTYEPATQIAPKILSTAL